MSRPLRILALVDERLKPPENPKSSELRTADWKMEYDVVATLANAGHEVHTLGVGSDGPSAVYQPPCSQGPGAKVYTFTVYALSGPLRLSTPASQTTGAVVTSAVAPLTLGSASLSLSYTRPR